MVKDKKNKIPDDFLLNPDMIEEFLGMFEAKIEFFQGQLDNTIKIKTQLEQNISQLTEKRDIMTQYLEFVNNKGFGYIKQNVDEYFKNMKAAGTNRVSDNYCGKDYILAAKHWSCMKTKGHVGDCGVV